MLQAVEMRGETDGKPSYALYIVLPFILELVAVAVMYMVLVTYAPRSAGAPRATGEYVVFVLERVSQTLYASFLIAIVMALAAIVLAAVGLYKLIDRRNQHLARDHVLRQGVLDYTRTVVEQSQDPRAGRHLEKMQRIHNQALLEENQRPAGIHLLLIPLTFTIWYFYVVYFLLKDVPRHARRQARFVRETRGALEASGWDPELLPIVPPIQERSFVLSLIALGVLGNVGGLLVHYWLFKDPPKHFEAQWAHEDALIALVDDAPAMDAPSGGFPGGDLPAGPPLGDELPGAELPGDDPAGTGPPGEASGAQEADPPSSEAPPSLGEDPDGAPVESGDPGLEDLRDGPSVAGEPAEITYEVWACQECQTRYKVPPERPVRVTCKACGWNEILDE